MQHLRVFSNLIFKFMPLFNSFSIRYVFTLTLILLQCLVQFLKQFFVLRYFILHLLYFIIMYTLFLSISILCLKPIMSNMTEEMFR
jgi:hypothetical protein